MDFSLSLTTLWHDLGWPLVRMMAMISLGLIVANLIESLNWTRSVARLASPLIRFGNLSDISGASFSMAFFSGVAANSMLAEAYDQKKISRAELLLANLFNSLPTYFLHLPTMFFIALPLIGRPALLYVGLTLLAAVIRTLAVLVVGRFLLAPPAEICIDCQLDDTPFSWPAVLTKGMKRFRLRITKVLFLTVPIYICFYLINRAGLFSLLEESMASQLGFLSWLRPEALTIVAFHVAAEFTAGLAAAGALLEGSTLSVQEIITALLIGNILSSPVRAIRHQLPFYAGIFPARLALLLVVYNQLFRMGSIILVTIVYLLTSLPATL